MLLTNKELQNYVERIKFSRADKRKYQSQIDNFISLLSKSIDENTETKVVKVQQAGSWKKGTILKPDSNNPVDIDLVFYLDIDDNDFSTLEEVNDLMINFLRNVYPNKERKDFWDNPKTAGLEFISSGLNVDIVPVKQIDEGPYVEQPDKSFKKYVTSPQGQIDFISERKSENPNFSAIVRILKKWKNCNKLKISSFIIEIICAQLEINEGNITNISDSLCRFFEFLGRKNFPEILFGNGKRNSSTSFIYIADPTNDENNTAEYISEKEWNHIRSVANRAFERIFFANELDVKNKSLDLWKEEIDRSFNIKDPG